MRRSRPWLRVALFIGAGFAIAEYVALAWLAPRYVTRLVEQIAGSRVAIGHTQLSFPLTTTLTDLRLVGNASEAALTIPRVVIRPRWLSLPRRTLWLDTVDIERPYIRLHRTAAGTVLWPSLHDLLPASAKAAALPSGWRVRIDSLILNDAAIEFVDERAALPFHGSVDHLLLVAGPLALPLGGAQTSLALQAKVIGAAGYAAPISCSGWMNVRARNLEAACQLEPIALKAFESYYQGPAEVRVYEVTVKSTSQWVARANDFTGRVQFELGNLREGDLSVHGRTIIDVKRMTKSGEGPSSLKGEVNLTGPLDAPRYWHLRLISGDDEVQQLIARLEEHGVKAIKLPFFGPHARLSLVPPTEATAAEIEAAGKEMQEALEILANPASVSGAAEATLPAVQPPGSSAPAPAPAELPGEPAPTDPRPPAPASAPAAP